MRLAKPRLLKRRSKPLSDARVQLLARPLYIVPCTAFGHPELPATSQCMNFSHHIDQVTLKFIRFNHKKVAFIGSDYHGEYVCAYFDLKTK